MNIYEKLAEIQHELKCNKSQFNSFGNFKFRSCEDILEAVKPLCYKNKATLVLSDEMVCISERYYIKATATLYDQESEQVVSNTSYAREAYEKPKMDDSQITGTASSYARKYALNGLFNIDDTKDADTDEYQKQTEPVKYIDSNEDIGDKPLNKVKLKTITDLNVDPEKAKEILAEYGYDKSTEIKTKDYAEIFKKLKELV